ncbi:TMEM175 family protein [Glycocaulis sp.]|uniref:TMEM175 family protein n=1 Tax=Glycocaulis sp. TaxID=1969725 RepID=UPI003F722682
MVQQRTGETQFRWRGENVSRLENLSDIIFALVLTLAALQSIPSSFDELVGLWRGAISIAVCFALVLLIWRTHHVFFRRYGLDDATVTALNALLLFLVLIYIYPLKFMTDFVVNYFTGGFGNVEEVTGVLTLTQVPVLYAIYGGFFGAVYGVFALLYAHALRHADALELTTQERSWTRFEIEFSLGTTGLSLAVIALAFLLPDSIAAFAGILFSLMGLIAWLCSARAEARIRQLGAAAF